MNYFSFKLKKTFVFSAFLVLLLLILIEVAAILIEKVKARNDIFQISPILLKSNHMEMNMIKMSKIIIGRKNTKNLLLSKKLTHI